MKKGGMIFAILIVIFLVSGQGCERSVTRGGEGVFIGGKSGLLAEFIEDAPTTSGNYKGESFPIEIRLTNQGETDIGEGSAKFYLTGALYSDTVATVPEKESSNDAMVMAI